MTMHRLQLFVVYIVRKLIVQLAMYGFMAKRFSFVHKMSCGTLSKALLKSKEKILTYIISNIIQPFYPGIMAFDEGHIVELCIDLYSYKRIDPVQCNEFIYMT